MNLIPMCLLCVRLTLKGKRLSIKAPSALLKLFDPVKFNFVSLSLPVVKLNESIDVFLLSLLSYEGNVSFEVIIGRNIGPCVITHSFWTSSFFGVSSQLRDRRFVFSDFLTEALGSFLAGPLVTRVFKYFS